MSDLPMPSEVKKAVAAGGAPHQPGTVTTQVLEPPSAKLIVRLFLIPLLIVGAAVGVMFLIGLLTGGSMTIERAFEELEKSGGERTAGVLVGPASKQRYQAAKVVSDHVMERLSAGMSEQERAQFADRMLRVVDKAHPHEGMVKPVLMRAMAMAWTVDLRQPPMDSDAAVRSRRAVLEKLLSLTAIVPPTGSTEKERHEAARQQELVRTAAITTVGILKGRPEVRDAIGPLVAKLNDASEALDVRIAAASTLGKIADPQQDQAVISALEQAMRSSRPEDQELVWNAALGLAQLNQPQAADTILMLLTRSELDGKQVLDRETDWRNPVFRPLNDQEKQRFLINAMQGAIRLQEPRVQAKIRDVAANDPSIRVREAGQQELRAPRTP